ncbi:MAG: YrdB family protein [Segetibacter sp.]
MIAIKFINSVIAFALELCMLFGLSYWGYQNSNHNFLKYLFAIALPLIAAILWANFAAPKSKTRLANPYRTLFKLWLFITTAFLIYEPGHLQLAIIFGAVALLNEIVAFLLNQ